MKIVFFILFIQICLFSNSYAVTRGFKTVKSCGNNLAVRSVLNSSVVERELRQQVLKDLLGDQQPKSASDYLYNKNTLKLEQPPSAIEEKFRMFQSFFACKELECEGFFIEAEKKDKDYYQINRINELVFIFKNKVLSFSLDLYEKKAYALDSFGVYEINFEVYLEGNFSQTGKDEDIVYYGLEKNKNIKRAKEILFNKKILLNEQFLRILKSEKEQEISLNKHIDFFETKKPFFASTRKWSGTKLSEIPKEEKAFVADHKKSHNKAVVLPTNTNYVAVGDLHGDKVNAEVILNKIKYRLRRESDFSVVFLGDYVDRGLDSLGVLLELLVLKTQYPDRVFLLMGNHELREVNYRNGFLIELQKKFGLRRGLDLAEKINELFAELPLFAVTGDGEFLVHGGIVSKLEEQPQSDFLRILERVTVTNLEELLEDEYKLQLLWDDPLRKGDKAYCLTDTGWALSARDSYTETIFKFNEIAVDKFCRKTGIKRIIRAHEFCSLQEEEKRICCNGKVYTVFSTGVPSGLTGYEGVPFPYYLEKKKDEYRREGEIKFCSLLKSEKHYEEFLKQHNALKDFFSIETIEEAFKIMPYQTLYNVIFCKYPHFRTMEFDCKSNYELVAIILNFFYDKMDYHNMELYLNFQSYLIRLSKKITYKKAVDLDILKRTIAFIRLSMVRKLHQENLTLFKNVLRTIPEDFVEALEKCAPYKQEEYNQIVSLIRHVRDSGSGKIVSSSFIDNLKINWQFKGESDIGSVEMDLRVGMFKTIKNEYCKQYGIELKIAPKEVAISNFVQVYRTLEGQFYILLSQDCFDLYLDLSESECEYLIAVLDFGIICELVKIFRIRDKKSKTILFKQDVVEKLKTGEMSNVSFLERVKNRIDETEAEAVLRALIIFANEKRFDDLREGLFLYYNYTNIRSEDKDIVVSDKLIEKYKIPVDQNKNSKFYTVKLAILIKMINDFEKKLKEVDFEKVMQLENISQKIQEELNEIIKTCLVDMYS
jgi:hypothetical protein